MNKMKEYAQICKQELKEKIRSYKLVPTLLIIQVGNDEASSRYIRNKIKDCEEVGITAHHYHLLENISTDELVDFINSYQWKYDGVIVQ